MSEDTTVPINWIAVGNPVHILSPDKHDETWAIQKPLNFPLTVYGIDRPKLDEPNIRKNTCKVISDRLGLYNDNETIKDE